MARAFHTLALVAALLAVGCTVHEAPAPTPTGPSELSLSLIAAATPDTIAQDGASQALVVVIARDVNGRAVANLPIRFDVMKDGQIVDFGSLSSRTGVTAGDGRVQTTYTAPGLPQNSADIQSSVVSVLATPGGTNYANAVPRSVEIRLVPPGVVPPPDARPKAEFTGWDQKVGTGVAVVFDASSSSSPNGIASYSWDFGDQTVGTGVAAQHSFGAGGTYQVRLTVTDRKGQTAWVTHPITVAPPPAAVFTWTPASPAVGSSVTFDARGSWAVPPATIKEYAWVVAGFSAGTGDTLSWTFGVAGTYTVTLTVTDSNGLVGRSTQSVEVR